MSANYTPDMESYKPLTPFKMQVQTNFPYIEADFDAITNYELLCRVVDYLNTVIANENSVETNVTSLYNAYVALQNYVNDYFENLDVQEEINKKLDEMAEDGSLTALIKAYVDPIYEAYENVIDGRLDSQDTNINNFKSDVNTQLNEISSQVEGAVSGKPLIANTSADMTDTSSLYVLLTDGYVYYYNGEEWTQGWLYQAANNPDVTGLNHITENLLLDTKLWANGYVGTNGNVSTSSSAPNNEKATFFVEISASTAYTFMWETVCQSTDTAWLRIGFYDEDFTFISKVDIDNTNNVYYTAGYRTGYQSFTSPATAKYIRCSFRTFNGGKAKLFKGSIPSKYSNNIINNISDKLTNNKQIKLNTFLIFSFLRHLIK